MLPTTGWQHQVWSHDRQISQSSVRDKSLYKQQWAGARGLLSVLGCEGKISLLIRNTGPTPGSTPM